jgi:hypothetical protein
VALTLWASSGTAPASARVVDAPSSPGIWRPAPGTTWQWQIVGRVRKPFLPVSMYDIDLQDAVPTRERVRVPGVGSAIWPRGVNAHAIARLHAAGRTVVCYLDSGAYEDYRPDAGLFPRSVLGNSTGWAGERWLDIRPPSRRRFAPIIWARLRLAAHIGCDGVEPDENNPWGNRPGFPVALATERSWYLTVARHAHALGLSVGMKNGLEVVGPRTVRAFDWALNEECFYFHECARMSRFVRAGNAVFQTEYVADWRHRGVDSATAVADRVCGGASSAKLSTLVKRVVPDRRFVAC